MFHKIYSSFRCLNIPQNISNKFLINKIKWPIVTTSSATPTLYSQSFHTSRLVASTSDSELEDENVEVELEHELAGKADVETSIRYLKSKAYEVTYRGKPVWMPYRRNHKGAIPPTKTRRSCIKQGKLVSNNPCPICRDKYLTLDPINVGLLEQFLDPHTGEPLQTGVTNLCRKQHRNLLVAIEQAWDKGYIEMTVPHRKYDYKDYYSQELLKQLQ